MEHADDRAKVLNLREVVGTEQNSLAPGMLSFEDGSEFPFPNGVESCEGFIEDEKGGVMDQGLGNAQSLFHSLGKGSDATAGAFAEADFAQGVGDVLAGRRGEWSIKGPGIGEKLFGGEVGGKRDEFRKKSNRLAKRKRINGLAAEENSARLGKDEAEDGLEEGGFPSAVAADEAVQATLADGKIQPFQHFQTAVGFDKSTNFKHWTLR